jgi:hypothetical protein
MEPGTNFKKLRSDEQNCSKLKPKKSDKPLLSGAKNAEIYMVTFCHRFVSTDTDFFKSSPKKCQFLGQGYNLQKIIGRQRIQCTSSTSE